MSPWPFAVAPCNWLSADRQGTKPSAECSLSWPVPDVPWAWGTVSRPLIMGSGRLSFNIDNMLSLTSVICLTQWFSLLVCCPDILSIEASMEALTLLHNWKTTLCNFSMLSAQSLTTCWHVSLNCMFSYLMRLISFMSKLQSTYKVQQGIIITLMKPFNNIIHFFLFSYHHPFFSEVSLRGPQCYTKGPGPQPVTFHWISQCKL